MRKCQNIFVPKAAQRGFSLLEILITLVIIAIAMLGTAGLQLNAMRLSKGSQFRTQAIFLASDIAERMEANKVASVAGTYAIVDTNVASVAATDCSAVVCTPANLAAWDQSQWETAISTLLPQASWQITATNVQATPTLSSVTYQIVIRWIDRSDVKTVNSGGIVDSFTTNRTVQVLLP